MDPNELLKVKRCQLRKNHGKLQPVDEGTTPDFERFVSPIRVLMCNTFDLNEQPVTQIFKTRMFIGWRANNIEIDFITATNAVRLTHERTWSGPIAHLYKMSEICNTPDELVSLLVDIIVDAEVDYECG